MGAKDPKGYGRIQVRPNGTMLVHRLAWVLANGPIPPGFCVLHKCDNPPCVRLEHLFLGTLLDNNADMMAKGRHAKGQAFRLAVSAGIRRHRENSRT